MATLFETYEEELLQLTTLLKRRITSDLANSTGDQRKNAIRKGQQELAETEEIMEQMEVELKMAPSETKAALTSRFRNYQHDLDKLSCEFNRAVYAQEPVGSGFDLGDSDNENNESYDVEPGRDRLLTAQERLNNTSNSLQNSQRLAEESEQVGISVLNDLYGQRETIINATDSLRETNSNLSRSDRILRSMTR
eukprot:Ihof_evm3s304 gene=Ihof_evmTU3s304